MIVREKMYPPQLSPEFVDFLSGRSGNWEEGGKGWEVELAEEDPGGNPGWFELVPGNGSQLNPPWSAGSNLWMKEMLVRNNNFWYTKCVNFLFF